MLCLRSVDHLFLHCHVSRRFWHKLIHKAELCWIPPRSSLGKIKRAVTLWRCMIMAPFWVIWVEKNARLFEDWGMSYGIKLNF